MDDIENKSTYIFWIRLPREKTRVWLIILCPAALSLALHSLSLIVDISTACGLAANGCPGSAVAVVCFVYLPAAATLLLDPPEPPQRTLSLVEAGWLLIKLLGYVAVYPILVTVRLVKRLLASSRSLNNNRNYDDILSEYEHFLSKETHSYLFLNAFLHCTPQAILQLNLLVSGSPGTFTVFSQSVSLTVSLVSLAVCVVSYHRYEAQVIGGRRADLLLRAPQSSDSDPETTLSLLPIKFCLRSKVISLPADCLLGRYDAFAFISFAALVAFAAWVCLICPRLLCLVVAYQTHPAAVWLTLLAHCCLTLFYFLSSQATSPRDLPCRFLHAVTAILVLVEVSVRFYKIPLLYSLFVVSVFVEDTYLMFLFYIYRPFACSDGRINCSWYGVYAYLVMNLHLVAVILFGIYFVTLRPLGKSLVASSSITSIVTS